MTVTLTNKIVSFFAEQCQKDCLNERTLCNSCDLQNKEDCNCVAIHKSVCSGKLEDTELLNIHNLDANQIAFCEMLTVLEKKVKFIFDNKMYF